MKKPITVFTPNTRDLAEITPYRDIDTISDEPMLFSADWNFALENGGPITQEVLDKLAELRHDILETRDKDYPYLVIDTRVHMLMKGMYPAIPGWHCDCSPRRSYNSQPDLVRASKNQINYTVCVSTVEDLAQTVFMDETITVPYDPDRVWGSINDYINERSDTILVKYLPDGIITEFNGHTLHSATAATKRGWRYFFRLSFMSKKPSPKIRRQVQVYTTLRGW